MRIVVTAGNTQTPVDRVRCITNIFSGRTGTRIAREALRRGHAVHLLTSHPELVRRSATTGGGRLRVTPYRTFDDLRELMTACIPAGGIDAIVHCAAVSDYRVAGVYARAPQTSDRRGKAPPSNAPGGPRLMDVSAGKVKSQHREMWLQLVPTPKLIDQIRGPWNFDGILVKFKLEVDISDSELAVAAAAARRQSAADVVVANTLEGMHEWALLVLPDDTVLRVPRAQLAPRLLDTVESLARAGGRQSGSRQPALRPSRRGVPPPPQPPDARRCLGAQA